MKNFLVPIILFVLSFSVQADPRKDKSHPCAKDFPLHCSNEIPSDQNYWGCLGRKMNVLSDQCSEFMKKDVYLKLNACGKEILAFCPGTKMNYGNWTKCLQGRKSDLSNKCSRMLSKNEKVFKLRQEAASVCKKDTDVLCKAVSDRKQCATIITNTDPSKLTAECKAIMSELKSAF